MRAPQAEAARDAVDALRTQARDLGARGRDDIYGDGLSKSRRGEHALHVEALRIKTPVPARCLLEAGSGRRMPEETQHEHQAFPERRRARRAALHRPGSAQLLGGGGSVVGGVTGQIGSTTGSVGGSAGGSISGDTSVVGDVATRAATRSAPRRTRRRRAAREAERQARQERELDAAVSGSASAAPPAPAPSPALPAARQRRTR